VPAWKTGGPAVFDEGYSAGIQENLAFSFQLSAFSFQPSTTSTPAFSRKILNRKVRKGIAKFAKKESGFMLPASCCRFHSGRGVLCVLCGSSFAVFAVKGSPCILRDRPERNHPEEPCDSRGQMPSAKCQRPCFAND
jgi:hypothetical protein